MWGASTNTTFAAGLSGYACNVSHTPTETQKWSIYVYNFDLESDLEKVVFSTTKNRKIQSVACTPDGTQLIFSFRETTQGDFEIYHLDLLSNALTRLTDNDTDDFDVSISESGFVMAWQKDLADGRQVIALRTYRDISSYDYEEKTLGSANPYVQPSLSPNGKWLAMVQMRKSNFLAIRYDIENNLFKVIHSIPRRKRLYHPSVSSDGNIFGWVENKQQSRYLVKNISENIINKLIISTPGIEHPFISADGKWVFYSIDKKTLLASIETGATQEIASSDHFLSSYWMGAPTAIYTDTTPDPFDFQDLAAVQRSALATSTLIKVTGINTAAEITVSNGEYSINEGTFTNKRGWINNNDHVRLRHTAASGYNTVKSTVLTIGDVEGTFTSRTEPHDLIPDEFDFTNKSNLEPNKAVSSNLVTVSGITTAVAITVENGSYRINDDAYTSTQGLINNGDTVRLHHITAADYSTEKTTSVTISGITKTFTSTTKSKPLPKKFQTSITNIDLRSATTDERLNDFNEVFEGIEITVEQ